MKNFNDFIEIMNTVTDAKNRASMEKTIMNAEINRVFSTSDVKTITDWLLTYIKQRDIYKDNNRVRSEKTGKLVVAEEARKKAGTVNDACYGELFVSLRGEELSEDTASQTILGKRYKNEMSVKLFNARAKDITENIVSIQIKKAGQIDIEKDIKECTSCVALEERLEIILHENEELMKRIESLEKSLNSKTQKKVETA